MRYIEGRYIGGHNNDEFKETRKYEEMHVELKELTKHFGEVKARPVSWSGRGEVSVC